MGIPVMILGESGSGKTYSMRNLDPQKIAMIQVTPKPLPFRSLDWKFATSNNYQHIIQLIKKAVELKKEIIIIDDFQYVMAYEFLARNAEVGFKKFNELAAHVVELITVIQNIPGNIRCYLTWHTQTDANGVTKAKTVGKMLDDQMCIEGLFTIVIKSLRKDGRYVFSTQSNNDVCKSPPEMFESELIENDLQKVDESICKFYNIGEQGNAIQS